MTANGDNLNKKIRDLHIDYIHFDAKVQASKVCAGIWYICVHFVENLCGWD